VEFFATNLLPEKSTRGQGQHLRCEGREGKSHEISGTKRRTINLEQIWFKVRLAGTAGKKKPTREEKKRYPRTEEKNGLKHIFNTVDPAERTALGLGTGVWGVGVRERGKGKTL